MTDPRGIVPGLPRTFVPVRTRILALALAAVVAGWIAACSGSDGGGSTPTDNDDITSVQVEPGQVALNEVGETAQLVATARTASGGTDASASFQWSSSNTTVAGVDANGLVTARGPGSATVSARTAGVEGMAAVAVDIPVATVQVTPGSHSFDALGATVQLQAQALSAAGNVIPGVTATWSSSAPGVASVNASGLVAAEDNGTATITATMEGVQGSASIEVDQTVTSVEVSPGGASTTVGGQIQFAAQAFDPNSVLVNGATFTWSSSDESVAGVDTDGLATAVAAGQSTITATSSGVQGSATLTVAEAGSGSVRLVSGDDQNGKTQLDFDQPLVVEVLDAGDNPAPGVEVTWTVTQGDAALSSTSVQTDNQGRAQVTLTAGTQLVEHQIQASADGRDGSPVTFSARTTVLQVFIEDNAFVDLQGRRNRDFSVAVEVGDTIEWLYRADQSSVHTVTSNSEPGGGASFDSGNLNPGDTFRFVPGVTGSWEYFCEIHPSIMLESEIVVN